MWYLQEQTGPMPPRGVAYRMPVYYWFGGVDAEPRTIGRKNVDIRLKASSVSRTHATVRVRHSSFQRRTSTTVPTVEDSSAYGTFLKYPPGHQANRASRNDGHHDRLDKETPVEVFEGALLAFGAPSSWWRVGWMPILVHPHQLPVPAVAQLKEMSRISGLAISDPAKDSLLDATHLLVSVARAGSGTFLRCVVAGKQIVSERWVHAVTAMVKDACSQASLAPGPEAARAATAIPPEDRFRPVFSAEDVDLYGEALLAQAFDTSKLRGRLFVGVTFVLSSEPLLDNWHAILTECGAVAVLHANSTAESNKLVYVQPSGCRSGRSSTVRVSVPPGFPSCAEHDIVRAVLSADADEVLKATVETPVEPVANNRQTDVATPTPSDSDAETADNDQQLDADQISAGAKTSRRKRPRRPSGSDSGIDHDPPQICDDALDRTLRDGNFCDTPKAMTCNPDGDVEMNIAGADIESKKGEEVMVVAGQDDSRHDEDGMNQANSSSRKFCGDAAKSVKVARSRKTVSDSVVGACSAVGSPKALRAVLAACERSNENDQADSVGAVRDVRTFKRKNPPVAGRVGLQKFRAIEDSAADTERGIAKPVRKRNARTITGGLEDGESDDDVEHADVVESDSQDEHGSGGGMRSRPARLRRRIPARRVPLSSVGDGDSDAVSPESSQRTRRGPHTRGSRR